MTKEGGLGILQLDAMNRALLVTWWWRLVSEQDTLVCNILRNKYSLRGLWTTDRRKMTYASVFWKGMANVKNIFQAGMKYQLGRQETSFSKYKCDGFLKLQEDHPNLYKIARDPSSSVRENYTRCGFRNIIRNTGVGDVTGEKNQYYY